MKNRLLPIIIILIFLTALSSCLFFGLKKPEKISAVKLNELIIAVENNSLDYSKIETDLKAIVIDSSGNVLYPANFGDKKSYAEWENFALRNDYIIMDFSGGKILVEREKSDASFGIILTISLVSSALIVVLIIYHFYLKKSYFTPFKKLRGFALEIAQGDFEKPLPIDKKNLFGAFSESFDIMRVELKASKEKEIQSEKSKKELMAELSHDIKTPVSTIKAVLEVIKLNDKNKINSENIETIEQKAAEIDNLITDMFSSALEDLSALKINEEVLSSKEIIVAVNGADYMKRIKDFKIPDCLIKTDFLRIKQVIGNIINNSYKYAGTDIEIFSEINDGFLDIEFKDSGSGVPEEELPLISNKFYRGKNAKSSNGAGLGLYICKNILEKTGGKIDYYNSINGGFAVKISIRLA